MKAVSILSLRDADRDADGFAAALGRTLEGTGFAIIADHGIDAALIADADEKARAFFALSEAEKRRCHIAGGAGQRGYTPFGTEAAKDADAVDLKEFWHVGRELPAGHPHAGLMPPNVWPDAPEGFRATMLALFAAFEMAGARLLGAIGRHLGLAPDYFADAIRDGNSVLRVLHYPPVAGQAAGIRAAAHEDINAITLLLGAEEAGLELLVSGSAAPNRAAAASSAQLKQTLPRDGEWLAVAPPPGALVMNVGDMLQRLTNGRLRSTTHRVTNPPPDRADRARYSMPFFLHFRPDFLIAPLAGMGDGLPLEPITADAFLRERLREIRLL